MPQTRMLTQSRFRLAVECPTKLFYTGKADYADRSENDPFLKALAEGGFQAGELAKAYHPGGHDLQSLDDEAALEKTKELLQLERVTIFEAAVRHENLFIRIDVLCKDGNLLDLIDVKARAYGGKGELIGKRSGKIAPTWKTHLMDVAFQDQVLKLAYPDRVVRPRLMLLDKKARATVDGLNRKFRISAAGIQRIGDCSPEALGDPVLIKVNVHQALKLIREDKYRIGHKAYDFAGYINALAEAYAADQRIKPRFDCAVCGKCEFRTTDAEETTGLKSGYKQCWLETLKFSEADFNEPNILEIGACTKKQAFLRANKFFLRDLDPLDFDLAKPLEKRQWLQVEKTVRNDPEPWIDREGLAQAFAEWTYPLHFIDFETAAVAIPFSKGRHPCETIAFQFSHHLVHADGRIEHAGEFLNTEAGVDPNVEFVRALKAALEKDEGTILHYAPHELTVLAQMVEQFAELDDVADRHELIDWIVTITGKSRSVVDLLDLVKKFYYQRDMKGSNSIKKVLPAVLNSSAALQEKYAKPAYAGTNFQNQAWIQRDQSGRVKDPYKLLGEQSIADGAAAANAYASLQFSEVPDEERAAVNDALLRYCELDTLAMVMIFEAWNAEVAG
ncbi:DUF2779 domain-containing protein [Pontiella sp.]|uniref:DUF2779 domain-containing protein n=1 Tax=Pontiella sp. TaxID=2837462 RepID=UPI0035684263